MGPDDFAYAIADPSGETATATVQVVVAPAPTPTPAGPLRARDGQHLEERLAGATQLDWVKAIAAHARAKNPAALVIPQNGSQLVAHASLS